MNSASPLRAVLGGFIATGVMTLLMYAAPLAGLPEIDAAMLLGALLNGGPTEVASDYWWIGLVIHFVNGSIVFPLAYAYMLFGLLPGAPWIRGTLLGIILWFFTEMTLMPMIGAGVFSAKTPSPGWMVACDLLGHLVYGAILGSVAGRQADRYEHRPRHVLRLF